MTRYDTSTIHRYLDGVFEGLPLTPEVQDLKEEIRGNLTARVSELEAGGLGATAASRKAIRELGDVREIIAQLGVERSGVEDGATPTPREAAIAAYLRKRVRPRPGFVVRAVVLSLALAGGAAAYVTALIANQPGLAAWLAPFGVALPIGLLVTDALRQETTSNHPLPNLRAVAYGAATVAIVGGAGLLGLFPTGSPRDGWLFVAGVPLVVGAIVLYAYLGATQTNRMKSWARDVEGTWVTTTPTRLEDDPAAAARFGIYSGILWILAIGAFIALSVQFGFKWSWVAFLVAVLAQMILLARTILADGAKLGDR